jgi:hypothetical protein
MTRPIIMTIALACMLATAACKVTGVAPPMGSYADQPGVPLGSPGSGAP